MKTAIQIFITIVIVAIISGLLTAVIVDLSRGAERRKQQKIEQEQDFFTCIEKKYELQWCYEKFIK